MTTATEHVVITEPGVYDLDDATYHGDPVPAGSLSKSGAAKLLDCPAKFDHDRKHPTPPRKTFDLGHAAHKLVLGAGPELREIPEEYLATNGAASTTEAREFIKKARADGAVPLKSHEYQQVQDMAAALRAHPIASALLNPDTGKPEQSLFWVDPETGVWLRARLDWLPSKVPGRRTIIPDYKTAVSADPWEFRKTAADYGYHMQHAMYLDAVDALGLANPAPAFVFIVQEKTAPYVVTVVELDTEAEALGRRQIRKAVATFAECQRTGHWPGYTDEVALVSLPTWYQTRIEESL
ncbi:PD-(D/E)XK nuclease-like domain-containing protein [Cellulosimicrobium sp. XJ-DQ-B-000]|uniref:PD-(D/E)XK nuclease-like domain-containing protein n=1 Tax=Cellulosimicrobium sp. XJ-DQ-B-000 TaxID=3072182 RepID=UPI0028075904|nr:PD-(D/E)XK nuclease-like domain-containing protein [Cellulosimicrobium sp. XJ-DQ-B-000]MDQ8040605.1 PD-(D/E)XK nuclease-like domain-containing protein [Cellulosimicrobium sp. XJ-DQ-B-000]